MNRTNETVYLFVGTSETEDKIAEDVYEYTLRKNCSQPLEIIWMRPSNMGFDNMNGFGTPFTLFRYCVPAMMGWKGRAIYTDCDMLNLRDIADLFNTDLEGKAFGLTYDALHDNGAACKAMGFTKGFFMDSVMLFDCEKAREYLHDIDVIKRWKGDGIYKWEFLRNIGLPDMEEAKKHVKWLDYRWNVCDGANAEKYDDPDYDWKEGGRAEWSKKTLVPLEECWQIHYTALSYQPWHPRYSPWSKASYRDYEYAKAWWDVARIVGKR